MLLTLDITAHCTRCDTDSAGRLYLDTFLKLQDSDGGVVFEDGWHCHKCLGEPWSSVDATSAFLQKADAKQAGDRQ